MYYDPSECPGPLSIPGGQTGAQGTGSGLPGKEDGRWQLTRDDQAPGD